MYVVRKYLGISGQEWQALSWAERRMLLEGMEQDEEVPFRFEEERVTGPTIRKDVDAGTDVIDLTKFREELEADRRRRRDGGD